MFAGVYLLDIPYPADRLYDYRISASLLPSVRRGSLVIVPFGGGNRRAYALVAELRETSEAARTKPILTVLSERYALGEEGCDLALFLASHTLCTVGEAVRALVPPSVFSGIRERFSLFPSAEIPTGEEAFFDALSARGELTEKEILDLYGESGKKKILRYVSEGILESQAIPEPPKNIRKKKLYSLAEPNATEELLSSKTLRSAQQKEIVKVLARLGECEAEPICETADASVPSLLGLVKKGIVLCREIEVTRNPYDVPQGERENIVLSRAQNAAYATLSELAAKEKPEAALLFGVTGSGKTNVVLKVIDDTIDKGKTVIMMVPEIALTPQTVRIFCKRYGDRVAVLHSSLTPGERFDAWRRIADGEIDLVVGTRSAVFAPLRNIGLIVLDEEHEHTYKSDQNPKYHARDVAAFRCGKHNALLILASATPSVESYYKAEKGIYTLVPIRERYGGAALPETEIVDMREELRNGNRSPISLRLADCLRECFAEEKQAILFLNRRGYNSTVTCLSCGEALACPNCSVTLTYHIANGGYLLCHLCGYKAFPTKTCPACGESHLSFVGCGTERAETELHAFFPDAAVLRMDADTATSREAYEAILSRFRKKAGDILLGTQMVTKGHDFPDVTLSGVLLADSSLRVNDFRASERTFSLLTQVIGRAGRADAAGRAVIQTFSPENPVIRLAAKQDYEGFYKNEIALRKETVYPPFCDLLQLTFSSEDEQMLLREMPAVTSRLKTAAKEYPNLNFSAFGPFEAQTYKVGNRYRFRMVIKCRLSNEIRAFFADFLKNEEKNDPKLSVSVDCNPSYV